MRVAVKLVASPQAVEDIDVAARWWAANRPAAPALLLAGDAGR